MIGIRADANEHIASGHIMRCMSIARKLRDMGEKCIWFVADDYPREIILKNNFEVIVLNSDYTKLENEIDKMKVYLQELSIDKLLIDSYYVTEKYLETMSKYAKITYLDDTMTFPYPVHRVINYALYASKEAYDVLYQEKDKPEYLLGTKYAPLRTEFENRKITINKEVENVFITSGATDIYDVVLGLAKIASEEYPPITFHIVSGMYNKNREELLSISECKSNIRVYENVTNIAEIMAGCDIAVSAGGTTLLELCSLGLPIIAYTMADNQLSGVCALVEANVIKYAGDARDIGKNTCDDILELMKEYIVNYNMRREAGERAYRCVDGNGAERIANAILEE